MLNVVFVPGLGLTGFEWHAVRIHLGDAVDQARAIALPSLGEPVVPGTELGVDAAADRVAASISGDEPPVVLVGHSAGCAVAVATAVRCPSVAGLVLVGPATDPRAATWPRMTGRWLRSAIHERLWELPLLIPQYRRTGLVSMARGMHAMRAYRADDAIARTAVPVTVVRGVHDRIAPDDWCRRLAEQAGGPGTVVSVPGAGHMLPITHPGEVAAAIQALQ